MPPIGQAAQRSPSRVTGGRAAWRPSVVRSDDGRRSPLTLREADALRLLAEGLCNAEIARRQVVTLGTIENRLTAVYAKLNVASRAQAVAWYYERGRLAMEESAGAARGDGATAGRDDGRPAMRPDRRDAARPASWLACRGTPDQGPP